VKKVFTPDAMSRVYKVKIKRAFKVSLTKLSLVRKASFSLDLNKIVKKYRHNLTVKKFVLFIISYWGDKSKEDEMGGACSAHGRGEKCVQNFGWKT
jgi:menaquinone-dependent protoporphyrinogen IX oxidase